MSAEFSTMISSLFNVIISLLNVLRLDNLANALMQYTVMPIDEE